MFGVRSLPFGTLLLAPLLPLWSGCGASVRQAASTGRGTVGFARLGCNRSGFAEIEFEILFGLMDAAGPVGLAPSSSTLFAIWQIHRA